jgi:hypothetical protein
MEEISWGEKVLVSFRYWTWTMGEPPWSTILKGQDSISFLTVGSSKRRPMRRLLCGQYRSTHLEAALDSLDIEDGVLGVHGSLVLRSLTDETFLIVERDERWGGEATLLVGDYAKSASL